MPAVTNWSRNCDNPLMPHPFDPPPRYSAADIDAIVKATGSLPSAPCEHRRYDNDANEVVLMVSRREALAERLETAAQCYDFEAFHAREPSASEVAEKLEDVRAAARRLLVALEANAREESRLAAKARYFLQGAAGNDAERTGGFDHIRPHRFTVKGRSSSTGTGRRWCAMPWRTSAVSPDGRTLRPSEPRRAWGCARTPAPRRQTKMNG